MKTSKFLSLCLAIVSLGLFPSCLGDSQDGSYSATSNLSGLFAACVDSDGGLTLCDGTSITVKWELGGQSVADVEVIGLRLPGSAIYPTLYINDVPWTYNSRGWMQISLSNIATTNQSGGASGVVFDSFLLQTVGRQYSSDCLNAVIAMDGYTLHLLPQQFIEMGSVKSVSGSGQVFEQATDINSATRFYYVLDPSTRKCFVVAENAQFYDDMLKSVVKFPDMSFTVDNTGSVVITGDGIVPTDMGSATSINATGTPLSGVRVDNFVSTVVPGEGVSMSFDYVLGATDSDSTYSVTMRVDYPDATASN